ncbi:hypothetical protein FS749_015159 [Ceratobasidium sp. UAMH 11750]|nr:hypothetical protein FS749_015159 [Ceratobasidium sp. UAMH 11750]
MDQKLDNPAETLETTMAQTFAQSRDILNNSSSGAPDEEIPASKRAREARQTVRTALKLLINSLDFADEQGEVAESQRLRKSALDKAKRGAERAEEQAKLARMEKELEAEREKRIELEKQCDQLQAREQLWSQMEQRWQHLSKLRDEKHQDDLRSMERDLKRAQEDTRNARAEAKRAHEKAKKAREEAARLKQETQRAHDAATKAKVEAQRTRQRGGEAQQQRQESASWGRYIGKWGLFKRFASVAGAGGEVFRFEDIPWPTFSCPTSPSMITKTEVKKFLLSGSSGLGVPLKAKVRQCLLTWHPDKFSGRWMKFVIPVDRDRVMEGVSSVTQAGSEIMSEYAGKWDTL